MKRSPVRPAALFGTLAALLTFCTGSEAQLDVPPEAMTLQTRNAAEVLPAEVRYVGMVNLREIRRNETLRPFGDGFDPSRFSGEGAARLQDFLDATGFDPEKDLREVYVAMDEPGPGGTLSLALYANFDRTRLQAYVDEHLSDTFESLTYEGVPIYRNRHSERPIAFAIASENMLVAASDVAKVHAMLNRLAGAGRALKDNAAMMTLIQEAGGASAWFVIRDLDAPGARGHVGHQGGEMDQLGRAVRDVTVSVHARPERMEASIMMVPKSGVSADDLADLAKGLVAAMKTGVDGDAQKMETLDRIRVRRNGEQVRVHVAVDNAVLRNH